jgi:hypothetical protein
MTSGGQIKKKFSPSSTLRTRSIKFKVHLNANEEYANYLSVRGHGVRGHGMSAVVVVFHADVAVVRRGGGGGCGGGVSTGSSGHSVAVATGGRRVG